MAIVGASTTRVICGVGLSVPRARASTYWGIRMTPCESWPRRLARTSIVAIQAASSGGTLQAAKMSCVRRSRRPASTVGMGDTLLWAMPKWEPEKIRLGVSACLLGDEVRYDGGHKRDACLVDTLGPFVEWVPVCPEVEVGLGVPRPAIRLVGSAVTPSLVVATTGADLTVQMQRFASRRVAELKELSLHGYVLKR